MCDAWFVTVEVRAMTEADGASLQEIERLAGERFREVGLGSVADDDPLPLADLAAFARAGRGWVAVEPNDVRSAPIGYVLVDIVDGAAHVEQITVLPDRQGTGVGRALLERVTTWARSNGCATISLTTFRDVPWNRPLYEHVGFRVLAEPEIGPELRAVRTHEAVMGLDPSIRVCMSRPIDPP